MRRNWLLLLSALFATLLADLPCAAQATAVHFGGNRQTGELSLSPTGELRFQANGQTSYVPLSQLAHVEFKRESLKPLLFASAFRVTLDHEQSIHAALLSVREAEIQLRAPWAKMVTFPSRIVSALEQESGFVTIFEEDQAPSRLQRPEDVLSYRLPGNVTNGRLGLNFELPPASEGLSGEVLVEWNEAKRPLRIALAGAGGKHTTDLNRDAHLEASAGRQRLTVLLRRNELSVDIDGIVVASAHIAEGSRSFRSLTVRGEGASAKEALRVAAISLARAVPSLPRPAAVPLRDQIWTVPGDQLFGSLVSADRRQVTFSAAKERVSLPWSEVRSIILRQREKSTEHEGSVTRVWFHSGLAKEPDVLRGQVTAWDGKRLTLKHAHLGTIVLDRPRLYRLQQESAPPSPSQEKP